MDTISSWWTGSANKCAVPKATGRSRGTNAATPVVIHGLRRICAPRIVLRVRRAACVPARPVKPDSSNSCPENSTKRCNRHGLFTPPKQDRNAMRGERALKELSPRVFALLAPGAHAIAGYREHQRVGEAQTTQDRKPELSRAFSRSGLFHLPEFLVLSYRTASRKR